MVLGHAAARLVLGFEVEHGLERLGLGGEQVALHVAERDARPVGDAARQRHRLGRNSVVGHDLVDDAEPTGLLGVDQVGGEIELARLGGADQPGQAPGAAVIAGIADPGEGGAEPRRFAGDRAGRRPAPGETRRRPPGR